MICTSQAEKSEERKRSGLDGIQILRGLAAVAVVLHHTMEESAAFLPIKFKPLIAFGASGVDLFFTISGFIMIYSTASNLTVPRRISVPAFLLRRFVRIFPLYWFCLLAIIFLHEAAGLYRNMHLTLERILKSFLLLPQSHTLMGVSWTLSYEILFYILFAFCIPLASRVDLSLATTLVLAGTFGLSHLLTSGVTRSFLTDPIIFEFALGMCACQLYSRKRLGKQAALPTVIVAIIAAYLFSAFVPGETTAGLNRSTRFLLWGVPSATIVWCVSSAYSKLTSQKMKGLKTLGDSSYSLYLTHPFIMTSFAWLLKRSHPSLLTIWIYMALVMIISIAVGLLTYRAVEEPVRRSKWRSDSRPEVSASTWTATDESS